MITLFSTPNPFRGHVGIIQINAIHSWKLAQPDAEVILFVSEEGAAKAALDLGTLHKLEVHWNYERPVILSIIQR